MKVKYSKVFRQHFAERIIGNKNLSHRFYERLQLFEKDPLDSELDDHPLTGAMRNLRSFSITGDVRVIYYRSGSLIKLVDIGSHQQVYEK